MINRVVLVGRLTKDPELRYTGSNIAVATFTLAVNRNFTSQDGSRDADFIQCVVWRKQAENVSKYVRKGSLVGVDGRIQTRSYEANDGSRRYITEVVCDNVRFLDTKENAPQRDFTSSNEYQSNQSFNNYQDNNYNQQNNFNQQNQNSFNQNNQDNFKQENEDPFFSSSDVTIDDDDLPF